MYVITANALVPGTVVFRTEDGGWSGEIAAARVYGSFDIAETDVAHAQHDVAARIILDPYAVEIESQSGGSVPVKLRERIRAFGPTVDYAVAAAELPASQPALERSAA